MNAPANIRTPPRIRVDETGAEAAHRRSISIHCPNIDEMEMAARCDIAAMRDIASTGMSRAGDAAATMLGLVASLGAQAVYAPLPASRLMRVRMALRMTIDAARAMERATSDGR